jgi:hypothetical protein
MIQLSRWSVQVSHLVLHLRNKIYETNKQTTYLDPAAGEQDGRVGPTRHPRG